MMIINSDTILKIKNCEKLLDYIGTNRYNPENYSLLESENFTSLPEYAKFVIYILDFETEYEMQGIFTTLENSVGHYLSDIATSFERTQNPEIASHLHKITATLADYGLTPDKIRHKWTKENKQYDIIEGDFMNNAALVQKISIIDDELQSLISDKIFWNNVAQFVENCLTQSSG